MLSGQNTWSWYFFLFPEWVACLSCVCAREPNSVFAVVKEALWAQNIPCGLSCLLGVSEVYGSRATSLHASWKEMEISDAKSELPDAVVW
jgi:hypothetical protein